MSIYSYLCCTDCKVSLWLGKAVFSDKDNAKVASFHLGPATASPNYKNEILSCALWKMLAEHHSHTIHTYFDYEFDKLPDRDVYREIGGEGENDIPFGVYLSKSSVHLEDG